jgi:hypothetical protein
MSHGKKSNVTVNFFSPTHNSIYIYMANSTTNSNRHQIYIRTSFLPVVTHNTEIWMLTLPTTTPIKLHTKHRMCYTRKMCKIIVSVWREQPKFPTSCSDFDHAGKGKNDGGGDETGRSCCTCCLYYVSSLMVLYLCMQITGIYWFDKSYYI